MSTFMVHQKLKVMLSNCLREDEWTSYFDAKVNKWLSSVYTYQLTDLKRYTVQI